MRGRWLAAALGCALAACGISAVGEMTSNAPAGDAPVDGSVSHDASPSCDARPDAPVVFLPADGATCPTGTSEETVQTNPQVSANACTCGACTPTADPACNAGTISVSYSTGNSSCNEGTLNYANVPNETCTDFGVGTVTQADYERWPARTPTGGTCTAAAMPDQTKVTSTPLRRCVASAPEAACLVPSAGQKKCIESTAPCGGDFPVTVAYGSAAQVECAACGCTRGATGCVVEHFSDGACTMMRYQQTLDGTCQRTDDATNVRYFKVRATGLTCISTPGAATASLANPRTLCCTN